MLSRTRDPRLVNAIINHPDVKPGVTMGLETDELDSTPIIANADNVALFDETGGFAFVKSGNASYDVHAMFLPSGRGPRIVRLFREALETMFTVYGAEVITAYAPDCTPQGMTLVKRVGFRPVYRTKLLGQPCTLMILHKDS